MVEFSSDPALAAPALVETTQRRWGIALRWAIVGLVLHLISFGLDSQLSGNRRLFSSDAAEWFVHFGEKNTAIAPATSALGHRPAVGDEVGHDGQWFWMLAHDPLLVRRTDEFRRVIDRPVYRAQRVAYPLVCSIWLLGGERALIWGMLLTNLIAVGVGGFLACLLLMELGSKEWIAIAFAICPGVIFSTLLDLADGLAMMWLVAVLLAIRKQRWGWALAAAVAGGLTKESTVLSVVAVALFAPGIDRARRWRLALAPVGVVLAWNLYSRWRLGWQLEANKEITAPFLGLVRAAKQWWIPEGYWLHALPAIGLLVLAAHVVALWWRKRHDLLLSAALPVACLLPFFSEGVIGVACNSLRAAGPMILFWLFSLSPRRSGA